MSKNDCDVLVIGAGPAGAATAFLLARAGYDVTLLDRDAAPRDKPCGEYLTPGAVGVLRDRLGVLPALLNGGAAWLTRETIVPHNGRSFGGDTQALACPRTVTDTVLRNAARAAGVSVVENISARQILRDGERVAGMAAQDENGNKFNYRAKVTVGADGTRSGLARALGVVQPIARLQKIALVGHFRFPASVENEQAVTMHLPSDGSIACCGVGAPCGPDNTRNVNLVVSQSESRLMAGRHTAYFAERLRQSFPRVWETWQSAKPMGPLRSVGCFGHYTRRASHDGTLLVGDAATFIHPFTGEGVYFALRGAELAANAIDGALRTGDTSRWGLQSYDAKRRQELLPRYQLCDLVQRVVHSPMRLGAAAHILRNSPALTDILLRTVGDVATPRTLFSLSTMRLAFPL